MPSRSRQKGMRIEYKVLEMHRALGIKGRRMPLSGALGGPWSGDLELEIPYLGKIKAEVKSRAKGRGFAMIKRWLGDNDVIYLHSNYQTPFVVLPWSTWERILRTFHPDGKLEAVEVEQQGNGSISSTMERKDIFWDYSGN